MFRVNIIVPAAADMFLDEEKLDKLIAECQDSGNYGPLKQTLWDVFSSPDCLGSSWPLEPASAVSPSSKLSSTCDNAQSLKKMTKEEVRALEGEKDVDSCEADVVKDKEEEGEKPKTNASTVCTVNLPSLQRSYEKLFKLDNEIRQLQRQGGYERNLHNN